MSAGKPTSMIMYWHGKAVKDMTRDELLVVVQQMAEQIKHDMEVRFDHGKRTLEEFKRLAASAA